MTDYINSKEAAELLRVTETHIAWLCRQGKLKGKKPMGKWLVEKNHVMEILGEINGEEQQQDERIDI